MQGTEYYDGKLKRYIDFPITDVLQMMGRAGRPQYDQHGKAVILVHDPKKSFYKKVTLTASKLLKMGIIYLEIELFHVFLSSFCMNLSL